MTAFFCHCKTNIGRYLRRHCRMPPLIPMAENVSSEAQIKNFFVSWKSYVPFSRYSSFCNFNHPMIYQICDIIMSIRTWDMVYFWIYLLNQNSLTHQTWSIDRYQQRQYFSEIIWMTWMTGAKFQALFN